MKKLMMILMTMLITVIGMSQTIGDSYKSFISTGHYEKGIDNDGNGYLVLSSDRISFKYYFEDGICNSIMIVSLYKSETDEIFNSWKINITDQYDSEYGYTVYLVGTLAKIVYRYDYVDGTKVYILETIAI